MDAGIIAKMKALLRNYYSKWAIDLTKQQILAGKDPSEIVIPSDLPTCKKNLFRWLSELAEELNGLPRSTVTHCWEQTLLARAWEASVQIEAVTKLEELFPNLVRGTAVGPPLDPMDKDPDEEDRDASWGGLGFLEGGSDEEWVGWVNWEAAGSN